MARRLSIKYVRLSKIVGDERNPKGHDIDSLGRSIERFGYAEAIVVDGRTGKLVSGHGRVETLRQMRAEHPYDPPEGIRGIRGDWMVPVQTGWASKDDDEALAFIIAANSTTERGGWDDGALLAILERFDATALDGTGFDTNAIDDVRARLEEASASAALEAEFRAKQIRSLIFGYSIEDFEFVTSTAARARAFYGIASNAELFETMCIA